MVDRLTDAFGLTTAQSQLLVTAAVIVVLFLVRVIVVAMVHRRIEDSSVWYRTRKALTYATSLIGLVVIASIWFEGTGILTYIGFLTAALAIALGDVVKNFAGWLYIVLRSRSGSATGSSSQAIAATSSTSGSSGSPCSRWAAGFARSRGACSTCPTAWCSPSR
jgi:hypothetical protein